MTSPSKSISASFLALLTACGTVQPTYSDGGGDAAEGVDGQTSGDDAAPDDDAALPEVDGGVEPDPDAAPDVDAAPLAPVHIRVNARDYTGNPDAGAIAVFQNSDGSVVFDGFVDGDGEATATIDDGGRVTVIRLSASGNNRFSNLMTVTDVHPGDELTFGYLPIQYSNGAQVATMPASYTSYPNSTSHTFNTPCDTATPPPTGGPPALRFYQQCQPAEFDLLLVATPAGAPRFVSMTDIAYAPGVSVTIPNSYQTMSTFTANFTNVPSTVSSLSTSRSTILGRRPAYTSYSSTASDPGTLVSLTMYYPQGAGDLVNINTYFYRTDATGIQIVERQTDQVAASAGFDLGAADLPAFTSEIAFDGEQVSWSQTAGDDADVRFVYAEASWPEPGGLTRYMNWMIASPPGGTSVTLPDLPAAYDNIHPAEQATINNAFAVASYQDYDLYDGYADARVHAEALFAYETLNDTGAFVGQNVTRRQSLSFEF